MGDKAWSSTNLGVEAACVISVNFMSLLFTDNLATNSIVVGLFILIVPALQLKGRYLRVSDLDLTD
jgi:hypothetical protein